jgi:hypothetical protein
MYNINNIANNYMAKANKGNGNGYDVKGYEFIWDEGIPRHKMK